MFDEAHPAAGAQHAVHLGNRGIDIGDRAERPGAEDAVDRRVGQIDPGAVESDELHGHRGRRDPRRSESTSTVGRFDGEHPSDRRRVVGHVGTGAETELEHLAAQALADLPTEVVDVSTQRDVDDEGLAGSEDLFPEDVGVAAVVGEFAEDVEVRVPQGVGTTSGDDRVETHRCDREP